MGTLQGGGESSLREVAGKAVTRALTRLRAQTEERTRL